MLTLVDLTLSQISPGFYVFAVQVFESIVEKEEIARNEQFLLFPQCFLSFLRTFPPYQSNLKLSSANSFSLEESTILSYGKGLIVKNDTRIAIQTLDTHMLF